MNDDLPKGMLPIETLEPAPGVAVYDELNDDWTVLDDRMASEIARLAPEDRWNWDGCMLTAWKPAAPDAQAQS